MKPRESGNVLFLILIAVALFAALSYAVTQSSRGGGDGATKEKNTFSGLEYVQIGRDIKVAVQRLMLIGGCSLEELSFDWSPGAGGITVPEDLHTSSGVPGWREMSHTRVEGVGSDSTANGCEGCELLMYRYTRDSEICEAINRDLFGDATLFTNGTMAPSSRYDGTFTATEFIQGNVYTNQEYFCIRESSGQQYDIYVHVIVPR
ncbi:MAG: hypothetical protein ACPG05_02995 [Bdellovibrionales bacterium]